MDWISLYRSRMRLCARARSPGYQYIIRAAFVYCMVSTIQTMTIIIVYTTDIKYAGRKRRGGWERLYSIATQLLLWIFAIYNFLVGVTQTGCFKWKTSTPTPQAVDRATKKPQRYGIVGSNPAILHPQNEMLDSTISMICIDSMNEGML